MRICWRIGITREQWRALPDDEKDAWLDFLNWRDRKLNRARKRIEETKSAYTGEVHALLMIERL